MNKTAHSYIGGLSCATIGILAMPASTSSIIPLVVMTGAGIIGGLFPDIDKEGSAVSHRAPGASRIIETLFGHRGFFHTPLIVIAMIVLYLLAEPTNIYARYCTYGFILGYISHLFLDFLTPMGIMLFYPFSNRYYHIIGLKGKYKDFLVNIGFTVLATVIILGSGKVTDYYDIFSNSMLHVVNNPRLKS